MGLIEDIIQGEIVFPRRFAKAETRDYGLLYYTTEVPDSHDGNHAVMLSPTDTAGAVSDVQDFYRSKGLAPRVRVHPHPQRADCRGIREALLAAGFQFRASANQYYVQRRPSRITPNSDLTIQRVRSPSPELLAMVEQSDSERAMNVVRLSLACPEYHLLVGFLHGKPVTMAVVERAGPVARVDDVLTHKPYRGKGYCRALIHELVNYHLRVLGGTLCLFTENPTAARVYEEAGFEKLAIPLECWSAWQD